MKTAREHLQLYPHARPRTLALIEARKAKTEQLQRENERKAMQKILKDQLERPTFFRPRKIVWPSWIWKW